MFDFKQKNSIKLFALVIFFLISGGQLAKNINVKHPIEKGAVEKSAYERRSEKLLYLKYYQQQAFEKSVYKIMPNQLYKNVNGGVVPHHLLVGRIIAEFFSTIALSKPETIILVGPNHKMRGRNEICSTSESWQTPYGVLAANKELIKTISKKVSIYEDSGIIEDEHSVAGLIPYIKYYMPDVKIVPIALKGNYEYSSSTKLGEILRELAMKENAIIVASVDFSHYLSFKKAEEMDEMTIRAIKENDKQLIHTMGNDNLDSPPSIITLLSAMEGVEEKKLVVLQHSNSEKILDQKLEKTTSYFTILWNQIK